MKSTWDLDHAVVSCEPYGAFYTAKKIKKNIIRFMGIFHIITLFRKVISIGKDFGSPL